MDERLMRRPAVSPLTAMLVMMLVAVAPEQAFGPPGRTGRPPTPAPPLRRARAGRARPADQDSARPLPGAGRARSHAVGRVAAAAQPDQHRHRPGRPHLGGRRRALPLASRPPARRRSHRRAAGHRRRRQGRQHAHVRAGTGADRAARRLGHRQQDRRRAAARPHRLHRRRSQPALRSGGGQARGAADRLPGHQPRPLAALGDGRPGRQVDLQLRQHRRRCSPTSRARRSASSASYRPGPVGPFKFPHDPADVRRQAERRRARLRRRVHGAHESRRHQRGDHRLQLPQQLRAVGHLARRRLPERQRRPAGVPRELGDGVRQLRLLVERRPADLAGGSPARPVDSGRGVAPGRSGHDAGRRRLRRRIADRQRLLRERRARRRVGRDVLRGRAGAQRDLLLPAGARRARASRSTARSS